MLPVIAPNPDTARAIIRNPARIKHFVLMVNSSFLVVVLVRSRIIVSHPCSTFPQMWKEASIS
jgi:hypothetical protein